MAAAAGSAPKPSPIFSRAQSLDLLNSASTNKGLHFATCRLRLQTFSSSFLVRLNNTKGVIAPDPRLERGITHPKCVVISISLIGLLKIEARFCTLLPVLVLARGDLV